MYDLRVESSIHLAPEHGGRNVEPTPDLPLCQTMNELGEIVSEPTGIPISIPDDGLAGDDTEMNQERGSEGSYQGGGGSEASLVNLRDRDIERGKGRDLGQILEGRR